MTYRDFKEVSECLLNFYLLSIIEMTINNIAVLACDFNYYFADCVKKLTD